MENPEGRFVSELRAELTRQVEDEGLTKMHVSWGDGAAALSSEDRARAVLAVEWSIRRGHSCRIECIDGLRLWPWRRQNLRAWLGDQCRRSGMRYRVWRDRYVLRVRNPYE